MNYVEQQKFVRAHWVAAIAISALAVTAFSVAFTASIGITSARGMGIAILLLVAACYGVCYLPLYLRISIENRKRYRWSIRVRLIALAALTVLTIPVGNHEGGLGVWSLGLLVSATAVFTARAFVRKMQDPHDLQFVPVLLLVGDLVIVAAAVSQQRISLLPAFAGIAISCTACAVTSSSFGQWVAIMLCAGELALITNLVAPKPTPAMLLGALVPLLLTIGAAVLAQKADKRHAMNVEQTLDDLTSFALVDRDEAAELLGEATGVLARSWTETHPAGEVAVARWYEENSEYYLYDLAQFHLAYKHISFMGDIARIARGRVLDFGAGIGDLALEIARRGHEVVYVDVEGRTKAFARWRAERDWIALQFASDLGEVDGSFDTIISLDVFEHLARPEPVIEELAGRLAPGGRMIVTSAFGPTKAHPMHFDHDIDLAGVLASHGLRDAKSFRMRYLGSEFTRKSNVLVFERP